MSATTLLPWAMLPDVVDSDDLRCGMRREGLVYSLFVELELIGVGGALLLSSYALGASGYKKPDDQTVSDTQPAAVLWLLRSIIGPISALNIFCALICVLLYPITKERHADICKQLELRNAKQNEPIMY